MNAPRKNTKTQKRTGFIQSFFVIQRFFARAPGMRATLFLFFLFFINVVY